MTTAAGAGLVLIAGIAVAVAAPGTHAAAVSTADRTSAKAAAYVPDTPLQIVSVTPTNSAHKVNGALPIKIAFNEPIAANSPMPTLSPKIAGSWAVNGNNVVFTPAVGYTEGTKATISIPGGASGVQAQGVGPSTAPGAGLLPNSVKDKFTTGSYSTLRLQQVLAQLGYLPLNWTPSTSPVANNANAQLSAAYRPPSGTFAWQSGYPSNLRKFWSTGKGSLIDDGAVRSFEWQHGLTMDGEAGTHVWKDLLTAIVKGQRNQHGYTYALASKASPETLTIWHNGHVVLHTLANTGIPAAPTSDGTFPVYLRYYYQVMKGTNPDGSKYADPVYYVAYFNAGEAVHYFDRGSYGFPQSLGCVELPWSSAAKAWPYLTYGSLVTVEEG